MTDSQPQTTPLDVPTLATLRQMWMDRTCFVCLQTIPDFEGYYHNRLHIVVCQNVCMATVAKFERDRTRSAGGRIRSQQEVLELIISSRPDAQAHGQPHSTATTDTSDNTPSDDERDTTHGKATDATDDEHTT